VVALALLGVAGFYLYSKMQQDRAVTDDLNAATQELERLAKRDPYPNPENIKSASEEGKRLQNFLGEVEKHFVPAPYPEMANAMEFRTYLDNTIASLNADAHRAGVEVPTNYWFTFAAQKSAVTFKPTSLQPLASQLADIRTLCSILFDAKVNALSWMKRVPVDSEQDTLGSQDYLSNVKASTNAYAVVVPYEVAFQGFSAQLATVLENLAKEPYCYIVTNLVVEPASSAAAGSEQSATPTYSAMPTDPGAAMRMRYGGRYGMRPTMPVPQPVVVQPRGPTAMLDEKQLRFILSIQAVKLKPQPKPVAVEKPQPARK
jgi:hypothetical protein